MAEARRLYFAGEIERRTFLALNDQFTRLGDEHPSADASGLADLDELYV